MKTNTIIILQILGSDIRTRSRAQMIRSAISSQESALLDFTGVSFMTRSFADELYNIINDNCHLGIVGMEGEVKDMFEIVKSSRSSKRIFNTDSSNVMYPATMKELSEILATF